MSRESPPCFQQRQRWYNVRLLKGDQAQNTKPLSYATQLDWINRIWKMDRTPCLKKTHAGRRNGPLVAEMMGVAEDSIRRAGRWNSDAMTNCYLSHIQRDFVRALAGFAPHGAGNYYLPRAKIAPPASLVRDLWPWVDQWSAWFKDSQDGVLKASVKSSYEGPLGWEPLPPSEEDSDDLAGQGFLRLLDTLRTIFLQDSVVLRKEFPRHPIWGHSLFVRGDYLAFAAEVELSLGDVQEPEEVRLRKVLPDIAMRFDAVHQDIVQTVNDHASRSYPLVQRMHSQLEDLLSGRFEIVSRIHGQSQSQAFRTIGLEGATQTVTGNAFYPQPPSDAAAPVSTLGAVQTARDEPVLFDPAALPPSYKMSRSITTVTDLWREWTVGLGSGLAVQRLEETYGARWRPDQSERVFFSRRLVVIREVERRTESCSQAKAVADLEAVREKDLKNASLFALAKWLRERAP